MPLINDYKILTPAERSLWRQPMMWLSAGAIALVPLLYATIYLDSSLDPYGNLSELPVALVNVDAGTAVRGEQRNIGTETVKTLKKDQRFNYLSYSSVADAEDAVQRGEAYFALSFPKDFSQKALGADSSQHGLINFYISEGGSYFASRVAKTFSASLTDTLNAKLGQNRWKAVQTSLGEVQRGFADIRTATGKLQSGAASLASGTASLSSGAATLQTGARQAAQGAQQLTVGAKTLSGGVSKLTGGSGQLSSAVRQLEAAAPGQKELAPLQQGAANLSGAAGQLAGGLGQLSGGAARLSAGASSADAGAAQLSKGSGQLAAQLPQLQSGLGQLTAAANQLSAGANTANQAAQQVAAGSGQLAQQLPALASGIVSAQQGAGQVGVTPLAQALGKLGVGAQQAAGGAKSLSAGATQLAAGTAQLQSGSQTLASKLGEAEKASSAAVKGASQISAGAAKLQSGTASLSSGAATLAQKTQQAAEGAAALSVGASKLQSGVGQLVGGNLKLKSALGQITAKLPAQADLTQLSGGAATLAEKSGELAAGLNTLSSGATKLSSGAEQASSGAAQLSSGLSTLYSKVPAKIEQLGGDPAGLSQSVLPVIKTFAPVSNNGTGFAPYFMALSLWVGVTLTTFIFPYQQLPQSGRGTSQFARMLRKASVPALLVVIQALLVVLGVHLLGVSYLHPAEVIFTAVASSLTFLVIVLALIFLLGAAGRLIALILLVLQLAASGGSYPVELSPRFFQVIHDYVPVTQSVNAFRHAISGAFKGSYPVFTAVLLGLAVLGILLGLLGRRRWEFVADSDFKPLVSSPIRAND
ncbi:YhgE/Pip domain-containing protein [Deinococcus detaillensis]|uniref:YhgE/Pip domain-containing protein n=1 Tax=Deinococcus detaillensis TaxID=2592048 RepID=A0A553V516_9DEIO|nr:YhgE/Pip domain-containing protein [Deinococcus detaillensis]TSA87484.1 YhgE/Pip domain-containing protein [Deinococcus detaillensis]